MFSIKANPTFDAAITIIGQGREQQLNVTFKHKPRTEYLALLDKIGKGETSVADALLALLDKWDADADLSAKSLALLQEQQPGADWAILQAYGEALVVARKGN
ncbi:hypothetical protein MBSD_n2144 [Mizugakiibacter sediminis]|uniref:Phage protein n=1 Tax=Mizugakiibacter sediminis TaxID=1475481 RepID=A0A0K8QPK9_9GAMM|nr:phage tail assembly chaperone [Mizugakiibacter sediminis]GAP66829.1 hypothetical protein MBSD_n2144 [Mizugakiibacter sediminis]